MAIIPTVRMKKETAVITVNADKQAEWEAHGYKVLDEKAPAKTEDQPKGKKAKTEDK